MAWRLPDYEPMNLIGSGPTGSVVLSRDRTTGTVVAIKYLSKSVYQTPGFADLFRYEAARLVHIDNPHLGLIYEYVEGTDTAAVVMEFIDGVSLRAMLSGGALDPQPALYVFKGILLGLTDLHGKGIPHGDLRPENVMIDNNSMAKVVDVGIAANVNRKAPVPGDARYRAPEMWTGERPSPTADVYAATATLYECLTGKPPVGADGEPLGAGEAPTAEEILSIQPDTMPDSVRRLMTMGLAGQPDGRAPDAAAMLAELELAARAYGPGWEKAGKTKIDYRLAALRASRRAAAAEAPEAPVSRITWTRTLVAVSVVVLLLLAGVAYATGLFSGPNNASASTRNVVPVFTHTPVPTTGPTVPPLPSAGAADKVKPQQVVGLHVIGRSQSAVTLTWNPSRDNVRVIGYIINRNGVKVGTSYLNGFTDVGLRAGTTYNYTVVAFDAAGNRSVTSSIVIGMTLRQPDLSPPTVPSGLRSTGRSMTSVVLAWSPSHDNVGVAGYDVFRGNQRIASVVSPNYTDRGLTADSTYRYSVRAFDTSNNASASSRAITVTTLKAPDKTKPSVPTGLVATGTAWNTIALSWNRATDNVGVVGYDVYRNGSTKPLAEVLAPVTSYTDFPLTASTKYTYTVRAVDGAGNESKLSASASAVTQPQPTPPPPTSPPPTTPPADPVVTSVDISNVAVDSQTCEVTVTVVITTTGAMESLNLTYDIAGDSGSATVPVDSSDQVTVTLPDTPVIDGNGTATVSAGDKSNESDVTAPDSCLPQPPPPPPTTTGPTGEPTGEPSAPPS
jgi:serine/threonine protein kinase/chitodextrinase